MKVSEYRRGGPNRCVALKVEFGGPKAKEKRRRSWRCQKVVGHEGRHESAGGHRTWQ